MSRVRFEVAALVSRTVDVYCASEVRNVEVSVVELGEFEIGKKIEDFGLLMTLFVDALKAIKMLK